jgi:AcrR family transcriptional regulator
MSRPSGVRNADYEQARTGLLDALTPALTAPGGLGLSFRAMADAAGVGPATLRHYFTDREGVLEAVLQRWRAQGAPYLLEGASADRGDTAEASLAWFLGYLRLGWERGVGRAHAFGLSAGMGDARLGPAYVSELLEPTLVSAEARLARLVAEGKLSPCDLRFAALELLSPVVLVLLHQGPLRGDQCRPLDVDRFLDEHLRRFLRAHAPEAVAPAPGGRARRGGKAGR